MWTLDKILDFEVTDRYANKRTVGSFKLVALMRFGSTVYGTNTEKSDTDVKGIYLPTAEEILDQVVQPVFHGKTKKDSSLKNDSGDLDIQLFSLGKYMDLLLSGDTIATDMFFVPIEQHLRSPDLIWHNLRYIDKDKILSKNISPFVSYCVRQAAKYGIKGSRLAAFRLVSDFLGKQDIHARISELPDFPAFLQQVSESRESEYIYREELPEITGPAPCLNVCGVRIQLNARVKFALPIINDKIEAFGKRALMAESNEGVDWKALSHAVRVAQQAEELLRTGHITFPRPNAKLLLDIKEGKLPYKEAAEIIVNGVAQVDRAMVESTLPESPQVDEIKRYLRSVYLNVCLGNI